MKITKTQLKQIIKEELRGLNESTWSRRQEPIDPEGYNVEQEREQEQKLSDRLRSAPTEPLDYDMSAEQQIELGKAAEQMMEIFVRVPSGLQKDLKDLVILNMEMIEKFQRPPQKPFSVTDPGETPTLQEQIKKILSEA